MFIIPILDALPAWGIAIIVVVSVLVGLFLIFFFVILPLIMAVYTMKPHKKTLEEARHQDEFEEAKKTDFSTYDAAEKVDYVIKSYDGYEIHVQYLPHPVKTNKYVICTHGYSWNRIGSVKYFNMFRKLGYNVIIYDNRGHGENDTKKWVTFGYYESGDLLELIKDTYKRYGDDIYLGLHGESMGTGLTINALKEKPNVRFVIADCGYGRMKEVLYSVCRNFTKFPSFLVPLGFPWVKILAHFDAKTFAPEEGLKDNVIPICYIHGDADKFVPTAESIRMDKLTTSYHELHLFEGIEHADCYRHYPERYEAIVSEFLKKIGAPE